MAHFMTTADKRRFNRVTCFANLKATDPSKQLTPISEGLLRNISKTGFALISDEALVRGGIYQFEIDLDETPLSMRGKVMHVKNEGTFFLIGVRIIRMPIIHKSRFNRFLASRFKRLRGLFLLYSVVGGLVVAGVFYFLLWNSIPASVLAFAVGFLALIIALPF